MRKEMKIEKSENLEVCKKCGGQCCKNYGGAFHPSDLDEEVTEEVIRKYIDRGDVSIDWYEHYGENKDINGYFLRMKHKDGGIIDPSYGGECVHLTSSGCELKFEERACGCRRLTPSPDAKGGCSNSYDKLEAANDWNPYHDIFEKMVSQEEYTIKVSKPSIELKLDTMLDHMIDNLFGGAFGGPLSQWCDIDFREKGV